ncbi:hypothetical protein BN1195_02583 [Chryseobacterium oranimense G311]|nr:hypothetical protein BN1195_02583 [Chryseobacterium oranimense G311]
MKKKIQIELEFQNGSIAMKPLCVFIFSSFFFMGFSQSLKDTARCHNMQIADSVLYRKLKAESEDVNYKKLTQRIINDIDVSKIPSDNLIINYHDKVTRNPFDNEPCECCFERLSDSPVYNDKVFWTKKNIEAIARILKKNIIPKNGLINQFIYDLPNLKPTSIYERQPALNQLVVATRKQKKGTYQKINIIGTKRYIDEESFFYFPYKNENLILNSTSTDTGTTENFNTLELLFTNEPGRKITVEFTYNEHYEGSTYKTYEYKNKHWQLINKSPDSN